MTKTTDITTTTAPAPLHWGWSERGQAIIGLSRLIDEYEQARYDDHRQDRDSLEVVQADEAVWAASKGWLWQGIAAARTREDLDSLAWACEEQANARYDDGRGWQGQVWEDIASYIWGLAA